MNQLNPYFRFIPVLAVLFSLAFFGCELHSKHNPDITEPRHQVYLRNQYRNYFSVDWPHGGVLVAKSKSPSQWDKFRVVENQDHTVSIQNIDNLFLQLAPDDSSLIAGTPEAQMAIDFSVDSLASGDLILRDNRGRYLTADSIGQIKLTSLTGPPLSMLPIPVQYEGQEQFTFNQLLPLIAGALCLILSVLLFHHSKRKWPALLLLFTGGLLIRVFAAMLNEYLFVWDEQFHALVAKNMMEYPFRPMLFAHPLLDITPQDWSVSHIWLHKQPLFMWQMALCMKIFGVNVFALRLHGIITTVAIMFMIWRIGKLLLNETSAFYGSWLFALSWFSAELVAGACHTEHNDSAFLFYVCAAIWSWVEMEHHQGRRKWLFLALTGFFAGCAVLVKWLPGLLVYAGWGLSIMLVKTRRKSIRNYWLLSSAFLISCVVFNPWQIYIMKAFPEESRTEFKHTASHFTEAVEGHGGDFLFHFRITEEIYNIPFYILLVCVVLMIYGIKVRSARIGIATFFITVYLFYSLAATKMPAFTFMISFLMFLAMGHTIVTTAAFINERFKLKRNLSVLAGGIMLLAAGWITFSYDRFRENHTMWHQDPFTFTAVRQRTIPVIKSLDTILPSPEKTVVFNCRNNDDIQIMFFSRVPASYCFIPDEKTIDALSAQGYQIAVFNNDELPEFLWNDPRVNILEGYWH